MLNPNSSRIRVALLSIIAGSLILAIKGYSYYMTGSAAIKSDAIEGIVNVVAAIFALGAVVYGERPADSTHPYGHGKIEYFSAAFEGGLISLAAAFILYEAGHAFINGAELKNLGLGLAINVAAGLMNGALGWFLIRAGRKHKSKAIEADGHHVMSDFYTTAGVAIGLVIASLTGLTWIDPLIAAIIGLMLARTGFKLVRESSAALLDTEDPEIIEGLVKAMDSARGDDIITVHELRTHRTGRLTHVEVHVVVPEYYEVKTAHDRVDDFGLATLKGSALEGNFIAHIDPCRKALCKECSKAQCPIRLSPCQEVKPFTHQSATAIGPSDLAMPHKGALLNAH